MTEPDKSTVPPPSTGIDDLDKVLQGLILGDNVVLQVESMEDYRAFVGPYVARALAEKRRLIYFRFARHAELLPEQERVERVNLSADAGFASFVTEVINCIEAAGREVFYLFDSLSELAADWFSDRMLANFFMIVCPYLYRVDTIAYFALMKKKHSATAIDGIHNTAQVIIDVFNHGGRLFVQPCKADGRYSPTLFTLHEWRDGGMAEVSSSAMVAEVLSHMPEPWLEFSVSRPGPWQEQFLRAQQVLSHATAGVADPGEITQCFRKLIRMALTRERRLLDVVERYLTLEDLIRVLGRMIGTGLIGGKALGMLLARAILRRDAPELETFQEPHDSFFVGSDVFYTHLVRNDCWWLCRGEDLETRLANAGEARRRILEGEFPEQVLRQFSEMLDYFGQSPLIVRSSSLLEDSYGNAFSGKYDSFFRANQGKPRERMEAFLDAVRHVYASSVSEDALVYRARCGLLDQDEQMALLVQRVSGNRHADMFMPHAAGVGFSFNAYAWDEEIEPEAGMLRMVAGLGTRAVDRTDDDYATLVALNAPHVKPPTVREDARRFSQKRLDVVDLAENRLRLVKFEDLARDRRGFPVEQLAELDGELLKRARQAGMRDTAFAWIPNLSPLLRRQGFVDGMRRMLDALEQAYGTPVDVEFTVNLVDEESYRVNLVQCRPLQVRVKRAERATEPAEDATRLFESRGPIIGPSLALSLDRIIYVSPHAYSRLPMNDRYAVARLIGQVARAGDLPPDAGLMLVGPGRWGTSTPALGVPVNFGEIEPASVIVEVAVMHEGLVPDVSLGTHFFNDLVELGMLYLALTPDREGHRIDWSFFESTGKNLLPRLLPEETRWAEVVRVIGAAPGNQAIHLYADTRRQRAICFL
ncbi:MAG: PEP/pyruvate-binding domain-containing protein [Planctomycetota bacterium]